MTRNQHKSSGGLTTKLVWIAVLAIATGIWCMLPSVETSASSGNPESDRSESRPELLKVKTNPSLPSQQVSYTGMDLSFNPRLHIPNWVAWELTADETDGATERASKFVADPDVAGSAETYDYLYSGYDRGHMAPAGDMKWDDKAMAETFFLTNICPQDHSLNNGAWKNLEVKCRTWARLDGEVYIVCGPVLTDSLHEFIGDSRVGVPRRFFKVAIAPYADKPRAIGFIMPNGHVEGGLQKCAVTIDEVERITGHDFFSELPDDLENQLESSINFPEWSRYTSQKKLKK